MGRLNVCFAHLSDSFHAFLRNFMSIAVSPGFYLKGLALFLTIVTSLLWRIPDAGYSGMDGNFQEVMFAHTVPGYLTVMFGLVVGYMLGDRPHNWFYYVFYGTGIALLLSVGVFGVYNCMFEDHDWGNPPLFMAFSNILTAGVITVDLLWSTGLFGLCDIFVTKMHKGGAVSDEEDGDKGL